MPKVSKAIVINENKIKRKKRFICFFDKTLNNLDIIIINKIFLNKI
tara:strand:- start:640 stop:777 length:138 start_codon:yes stop_codon:yes gene_type:complete